MFVCCGRLENVWVWVVGGCIIGLFSFWFIGRLVGGIGLLWGWVIDDLG